MRVLITGITGFVGQYLYKHLLKKGWEVYGTSRAESKLNYIYKVDFQNKEEIKNMLLSISPDIIFHLAAQSSVKLSWIEKKRTFEDNTINSLNLFEAVYEVDLKAKIVSVGSSEEYGIIPPSKMPVVEEQQANPVNPYGLSKYAVSSLTKQFFNAYGLDIVHTRTFTHIGVGQSLGFVTQDFAKQIVEIERNNIDPVMLVGNLEAVRDFTDVSDVVEAYYQLAVKGRSGEIYNVCSGTGYSIQEILETLLSFSHKKIDIKYDSNKMRPSDIPVLIGSNLKIQQETGWSPKIPISNSLENIINFYRQGK